MSGAMYSRDPDAPGDGWHTSHEREALAQDDVTYVYCTLCGATSSSSPSGYVLGGDAGRPCEGAAETADAGA